MAVPRIYLPLILLLAHLASCHCWANVKLWERPRRAAGDEHERPELVRVLESSKPLSWSGVRRTSELAHESQVVAVQFDFQQVSLSARQDAQPAASKTNKTKQSQDFELGGDSDGPSSSVAPPDETPGPIGLPAVALATSSSTTTSAPLTPPPPPPPANNQEATSSQQTSGTSSTTTTTTTTTQPPPPPLPAEVTSELPGGWPAATTEGPPVGSKTAREGAAVLCGEANANGKSNKKLISDRIVGGYKTEPGEFPFQVRLNIRSRRGSGICGGVVLDQRHILTAAHCMSACVSQHLTTATIETAGVKATLGDHSIKANDGEQELDVESITAHEKYDACNFYANDHDIALIKTASPIQFKFTTDGYGSINRPCMPASRDSVYTEGDQVIVSGWGVTRENSGALSNILRYVQVPVVNVTRCQETYGARVTHDHICAGLATGGKDSCQGDSGGPLVRVVDNRYELVGIVSFGYGCGQPGAPGVYTRVASYLDWIKANL